MPSVSHRMSRTPEHRAWQNMKDRCLNDRSSKYADYGGRGIAVCARWMVFENFFADMGPRPSPAHSLERKDNEAGYTPGNCEWATKKAQARNRRNTTYLRVRNENVTIEEWSERTGIKTVTLRKRLRMGWSPRRIVTTPILESHSHGKAKNANR